MKLLASIIPIVALALACTANSALAQSKPTPEKQFSVGPVIEFGGGGTSFGIQGKYGIGGNFSVRPLFLFGYRSSVSKSDLSKYYTFTQAEADSSAGQTILDETVKGIGTGFGYGAAITYDFKSPDSKIVGYVGPRILGGYTSGSGSAFGTSLNSSSREASIGLTVGADYEISPDFTAGLNATYNFYRKTEVGANAIPFTGPTFNVGLNAGYRF
jgi:Outer membrane protein beta-barrel domain